MIEIHPKKNPVAQVTVPGSKSYTHRSLIAAALAPGKSVLKNALSCEDTRLTAKALSAMGAEINTDNGTTSIRGGEINPVTRPIHLGNAGTSMRLLTAVAALGKGRYMLTGTGRMCARPLRGLTEALRRLGISVRCIHDNGCPPVEVIGGPLSGGVVDVNCSVSSQFLSALLMIAPYSQSALNIRALGGPVSRPYIDMTLSVMEAFGVPVDREGYMDFFVRGGRCYAPGVYEIPPDASNAGYFWAVAAVTGGAVTVRGICRKETEAPGQGDLGLLDRLAAMGCGVSEGPDGITVTGEKLTAIDTDMGDMPDMVPTLAVVAALAEGRTVMRNVAHLRAKESDRLAAMVTELNKTGISAGADKNTLVVEGGTPRGAVIDTYNDHRIAMSFAVLGHAVPGIRIRNEACVEKSFPTFWNVINEMGAS